MAIQNDNTLVTKGDLKDLYSNKIAPYLGANLQMKTNVSDYYSTNDKIVGIWIDGRPIYQKTYKGKWETITDGVVSIVTVAELPSDLAGVHTYRGQSNGRPLGSSWGNNNQYFFNAAIQTGTQGEYLLTIECNRSVMSNKNYFVTIQYTKTTDTASSALTTPGCYDINFPTTWPENKEIYFGNGLYGYRATGTTGTGETQFVTGITINYLVSSDGVIYNGDWHIPPGNWATTDNYITRVVCNSSTGLVKMNHSSGYNSKSYDVWFTYTK